MLSTFLSKLGAAPYAQASLGWTLVIGFTTTIHHLHAALILRTNGPGLHVVWNEAVLLPATVVLMWWATRRTSLWPVYLYGALAFVGFVGRCLYEGGWNHAAKIVGYLRLSGIEGTLRTVLPLSNLDLWFHEVTGILTFFIAGFASRYSWLFCREALRTRRRGRAGTSFAVR